ncbi:MAG TPA: PaaI family thioesterase, partial [Erythrobacter sp.]|nr:PaaI family thioesterase [Erythrobacter sp.]
GGLLETAGYAVLRAELARQQRAAILKPINITVQYLAAGKSRTSYAAGRITKLGRRSANLTVEAWQDDRSRPIATAVMNVLMAEPAS